MKKTLSALGATALLSLAALSAPVHAQRNGYYAPPAVVVPAPPQYYAERDPRWHGHDRRWEHRGRGDRDHDGIRNRYDRDRDGDGVPNRFDRRPNNPYRY